MSENETANETESASPAATTEVERHSLPLNGGSITAALGLAQQERAPGVFSVGDVIKVHYRIKEGDKERIQVYEGTVISMRGAGWSKSFVVRRVSHEVGVERIFPYNSPAIQKVDVVRRGRVRRAKLFYLRHKSGKEGRIKEAFDATRAQAPAKKAAARKKTAASAKKPASGARKTAAKASAR
ncbi:MAG: 50S ribosomal protein L19 [Leptospirales bacterium]|nr:50S ribosomal protein L19 [Leptospirales bacterium]